MLENKIEELTKEIRNLIIVMQKKDEAIGSLDKPAKTQDKPAKTQDKPAKTQDKSAKTQDKSAKTQDKSAKTTSVKKEAVNGPDVIDKIRANQKLALTVKDVTEQCRLALKSGVKRADIIKMINKNGAEKVADLDEAALAGFTEELSEVMKNGIR